MSQRKNNRSQHHSSDDDDDDDDLDEEFVPSQSQSQDLTNKDIKKLAGQVCNLLLVGEMKKIPVKGSDIRKFIVIRKNKSTFQSVMEEARQIMKHVFGYKIKEVKNNSYILVNTMSANFVKYQQLSKSEQEARGLLIVILTAIFMSEGKMSEGSLDSYIDALNADVDKTAKSIIQESIRKRYLETTTEESSDPPTMMYQWGDRAHAEFSKKEILEFACKVYGNDMKPMMWTYQWKIIKGDIAKQEATS